IWVASYRLYQTVKYWPKGTVFVSVVDPGVGSDIRVENLTHDIPPYDIWVASYRLYQTVKYWPKGTVFVSVVDPGVGSD
ncbi:SAM-dependent chlorinase/fluorinase, partial [Staphylococcus aureus]